MADAVKAAVKTPVEPTAIAPKERSKPRLPRGLRVSRRWSRPMVSPFDEVQWELRAATIGNEKGEVVFEQKDVEMPAFWSQLATNVVVSKYFRGTLGTPQRESTGSARTDFQ